MVGGASSNKARNCGGGGQGTRGAHVKHGPRARDAGHVKAQRLVERRRVLPSKKRERESIGGRGDMRASRREAQVGWSVAQAATRPATVGVEQRTRGAHPKHVYRVSDTGRVNAQRLVERRRVLPSNKGESIGGGATCGQRGGRVEVGLSVAQAATRPATVEVEGRARAERT